jgi:organic radical activating enzyme
VICEPLSSSILSVEELKDSQYDNIKQDPRYKKLQIRLNTLDENSIIWKELDKHISTIRNFEILGGEPLLNKNILRVIERLIDSGHSKHCVFQIITNGTQFPDICNQLHHFKEVLIHISVDNTNERFEYERYLGKWDKWVSNVSQFDNLTKQHNHIKLHFAIAVSILNALYLPELLSHISKYNFQTFYFGDVHKPSQLSLNNLTLQAKDALIKRLTMFTDQYPELNFVLNLVKNSKQVDGTEFCNFIKNKDKLRNLNFMDTHKEIGNLMGYSSFNIQGETNGR